LPPSKRSTATVDEPRARTAAPEAPAANVASLERYEQKRDFQKTPEPGPERRHSSETALSFVIQKHSATRLHYDLRLEFDGVLKSWAVPKGPSLNPDDKRLAMLVEDHPMDYASFEGIIPKGEYGAGQVIVWDRGTYWPDEGDEPPKDRAEAEEQMRRGLEKGKISVFLRGQKLNGSWALVKIARGKNEWLLIKHKDEYADRNRDVTAEDQSVVNGLTIEDLKAGRRADPTKQTLAAATHPSELPKAREAPFPKSVSPMLPSLTDRAFDNPNWLFEPKLDGVRAIALINDGRVKLLSRRGLDSTHQFPLLADEIARQPERQLVLDGEIVAFDDAGRPSFQVIQGRLNLTRKEDIKRMEAAIPVVYYVFDVLYAGGHDLMAVSLVERKALLERLLVPSENVRLVEAFDEDGITAYDAAVSIGLEGVLAKRRDSQYEAGRRSHSWLKVKNTLSDDFVIGGYTAGQGARARTFGALLIGAYGDDGKLHYVTNVGTGFDDKLLADLKRRLDEIRTDERPFAELPPVRQPMTWVRPELVAEVKFAERTHDGHLRAPVFLRLREDKAPAQAVEAEVLPAPDGDGASPSSSMDSAPKSDLEEILGQLEHIGQKGTLQVQGEKIPLTNLDKELWPAFEGRRALTKRDFLIYLTRVAPHFLRHLKDRPLSLIRFPNGIEGQRWFQKHWEHAIPEFVQTIGIYSEHNDADGDYMMCNNLPTLLWLGQNAALELHTWYSRISPEPDGHHLTSNFAGSIESLDDSLLNYPDFIVFDLDPYIYSGKEAKGAEPELNRAAFLKTCEVAGWLKKTLDGLSLSAFVKTSGRTGLHIYVPVLRQFDYDQIRSTSETIGRFVLAQHPDDVTMDWATVKRTGKVFLDHNQNVRGKTLASIYSPRVAPEATVSMPLRWEELGKVYPTELTMLTAPDRLDDVGDLWANILEAKHDLKALLQLVG
jgi:bifunctional non-homologous end joining protein LigD